MTVYVDGAAEHDTAFTRAVRRRWWCHMASDLPGEAGTQELLALGARIGLRRSWLQKAGTAWEHFDLATNPAGTGKRAAAIAAGAVPLLGLEFARRTWLVKRGGSEPALEGKAAEA